MLYKYLLLIALCTAMQGIAQQPQFAVVRPNGTTYICPSWDSAYNKSQDDDAIYIPGTTVTGNYISQINKKLTIIGAGHYPDSTQPTGVSYFTGSLILQKKCTIEGLVLGSQLVFLDTAANGSTLKRIKTASINLDRTSNHIIDGCVTSYLYGSCPNYAQNIFVRNSIISGNGIFGLSYSNFNNCILISYGNGLHFWNYTNCTFYNCIFTKGGFYLNGGCLAIAGDNYFNCVFTQNGLPFFDPVASTSSGNFLNINADSIFVNQTGYDFNYQHNYHLRAGSPYLNAGTDGTQIGLYGGPTPYVEGAVPSNPHIYFKQVDANSTSDGKLRVRYKVRSGN